MFYKLILSLQEESLSYNDYEKRIGGIFLKLYSLSNCYKILKHYLLYDLSYYNNSNIRFYSFSNRFFQNSLKIPKKSDIIMFMTFNFNNIININYIFRVCKKKVRKMLNNKYTNRYYFPLH